MSVEDLGGGRYRIGVHIADVSYFVKEATDLDVSACSRATSVYLVQTVVPMLPRRLCEDLCSLNPDEDRLAFSVEWTITEEGKIEKEWFGRTVIRCGMKYRIIYCMSFLSFLSRVDSQVLLQAVLRARPGHVGPPGEDLFRGGTSPDQQPVEVGRPEPQGELPPEGGSQPEEGEGGEWGS